MHHLFLSFDCALQSIVLIRYIMFLFLSLDFTLIRYSQLIEHSIACRSEGITWTYSLLKCQSLLSLRIICSRFVIRYRNLGHLSCQATLIRYPRVCRNIFAVFYIMIDVLADRPLIFQKQRLLELFQLICGTLPRVLWFLCNFSSLSPVVGGRRDDVDEATFEIRTLLLL